MQKPSWCLLGCKLTSQAALSESSFPDTCCHPSIQPRPKLGETGGQLSQLAAGVSGGHRCQPETRPIRAGFWTLARRVASKGYRIRRTRESQQGVWAKKTRAKTEVGLHVTRLIYWNFNQTSAVPQIPQMLNITINPKHTQLNRLCKAVLVDFTWNNRT